MLSEINQTQNDQHCLIPPIWDTQKFTQIQSRTEFTQGLGNVKMGNLVLYIVYEKQLNQSTNGSLSWELRQSQERKIPERSAQTRHLLVKTSRPSSCSTKAATPKSSEAEAGRHSDSHHHEPGDRQKTGCPEKGSLGSFYHKSCAQHRLGGNT